MNGMIKMYNREKGYGFIHGEDKQDYFFHVSSLQNIEPHNVVTGLEVSFEVTESERGFRAENVRKI